MWWRSQPPAYPPESPSSVKEYLEANYLNPELHLPTAADGARVWDLDWFELARPPLEPSAPRTMLVPAWEPPFRRRRPPLSSSSSRQESQVWDPESVQMDMSDVFDSGTGGITPRMPGPAKDFVRGSVNSRPFRPGGLHDDAAAAAALEKAFPEGARNGDWVRELMSGGPAQVNPPGFRKGLDLGNLKVWSLIVCWFVLQSNVCCHCAKLRLCRYCVHYIPIGVQKPLEVLPGWRACRWAIHIFIKWHHGTSVHILNNSGFHNLPVLLLYIIIWMSHVLAG